MHCTRSLSILPVSTALAALNVRLHAPLSAINTRVAVETTKATAAYGLLGVALGVALGLAGGLAGRSRHVSLRGAVVGGVLGGIAGAGLSMVFVPLFFHLSEAHNRTASAFLDSCGDLRRRRRPPEARPGLGIGRSQDHFQMRDRRHRGSSVATLAVEVINVAAFGIWRIFEPVPAKSMARILVNLCVALGTAVGALLAGRKLRARQS